jgi:F0F1-type ATP synthase assembly protein I
MQAWQAALRVLGVGWYIAIAIVLGLLGGLWLDGKFNTRPLFTIIGLIIGILAAVYGVYQIFLPLLNNKQGKGDS